MKRISVGILAVVGILTVMFTISCKKYYLVPEEVTIPDTVKFSVDIAPILDANCNLSNCHATGYNSPDLSPEKAYSNLWAYALIDTTDPENSVIYKRLTSATKPMPPEPSARLSDAKINLILEWIKQGAKE